VARKRWRVKAGAACWKTVVVLHGGFGGKVGELYPAGDEGLINPIRS